MNHAQEAQRLFMQGYNCAQAVFCAFCDETGLSLTAACADSDPDRTFSFNVSAYTQEELEQKRHNYELVPCGSTVLCIDHQMAGIGSKSCGPDLLPQYRVSADSFRFSFLLEPGEM